MSDADALKRMIACPECDRLHRIVDPPEGFRMRCSRCGTTILTSNVNAIERIVAGAVGVCALMAAALFFPFMSLESAGLSRNASVFDVATSFASAHLAPLAIAVTTVIIGIPALRAALLLYTLWPMRSGGPAPRGGAAAFRAAIVLKPWAMAEIFMISVAVALVKIAGMADVSVGPAFWAFVAMVGLAALEDASLCRWTCWREIERRSAS